MNSERLNYLLAQVNSGEKDPFVLYAIAMEYEGTDNEQALKFLKETLELFPDYLPSYYQVALLLEEMELIDECKNTLKRGIVLAEQKGDEKTAMELRNFLTNLELEY